MSPNAFLLFKNYQQFEKGWPAKFATSLHPDTRTAPKLNLAAHGQTEVSVQLAPRHCASASGPGPATETHCWSQAKLYRDAPPAEPICARTAKTAPCSAPCGFWWDYHHSQISVTSLQSTTQRLLIITAGPLALIFITIERFLITQSKIHQS
jgi:hypothetical protein